MPRRGIQIVARVFALMDTITLGLAGARLWRSPAAARPNSKDTSELFQRVTTCEPAATGPSAYVRLRRDKADTVAPRVKPRAQSAKA